jgi:HEAT repeat protein
MKEPDARLVALNQARKEGNVEVLIDFLKDPDYRGFAASSLAKLGNRRALEPLLPLLEASDPFVRSSAAEALGNLGEVSVLPRLKEMASEDPHEVPRMWAVVAVGKLAGRDEFSFLIGCLDDSHGKVRSNAAYALGLLGDARAVEPIERAKRKDSWRRRKVYRFALDRIRDASAR